MADFPAVKAHRLLAVPTRQPLNYRIARQSGSHRRLVSPGRRTIVFAYHDRRTVPPHVVRRILVKEAGLEESHARRLL